MLCPSLAVQSVGTRLVLYSLACSSDAPAMALEIGQSSSFWSRFRSSANRLKHPVLLHYEEESTIAEENSGLTRKLGVWDLVLIGIGASIGAGIFVITGTVAHDAGPGVVLSFLLAGLACVFNALCYAELSSRFPAVVGGAYLYTYSSFNELTAFLVFSHLIFDYHIGAANISRSLASYLASGLRTLPFMEWLPPWLGPGGQEILGGLFSINILAPILLAILTIILCSGVRLSATLNDIMTVLKVVIILVVIAGGIFEVDVVNWKPFIPYGYKSVITGATVVFFAYIGFDAVSNSAEESKNPQRDLPIGILVSLLVCAALYIAVCLVITGMVPYYLLDGDAPFAMAFASKGLRVMSSLIDIGAVVGLTTTVLVGLYVQSRLYLGLGRDGLLPSIFAKIDPEHHTPIFGQIWVGVVAGVLALLFDVSHLSHILSVGCLASYSVVGACVITLRLKQTEPQIQTSLTKWQEAVLCVVGFAGAGFFVGLIFRLDKHPAYIIAGLIFAALLAFRLISNHDYTKPQGFSCPGVPFIPLLSVGFNMFLFAQLHWEAWVRFVVLSVIAIVIYIVYGQHHAGSPLTGQKTSYKKAPTVESDS